MHAATALRIPAASCLTASFKTAAFNTAVLCAALLAFSAAAAAEEMVEVRIKNRGKVKSTTGLFISPAGVKQARRVELNQDGAGDYLVAIPHDYPPGSQVLATAVALMEDGSLAFADLRPVFAPEAAEAALFIPECPPDVAPMRLHPEMSKLEYIVGLRERQRDNGRKVAQQILSGAFLDRLQKFEAGFGLQTHPPLSADLNPYILSDRLSRILQALRDFAANQAQNGSE